MAALVGGGGGIAFSIFGEEMQVHSLFDDGVGFSWECTEVGMGLYCYYLVVDV